MKPLTKALVWLALAVVTWATAAGYVWLWIKVPVAAGYVTAYALGGASCWLADRPRRAETAAMAVQLDDQREAAIVVEAGAGALPPERSEPTVYHDGPEPESWLNSGERAITEPCAWCPAPANVRLADAFVLCFSCDHELRPWVYEGAGS